MVDHFFDDRKQSQNGENVAAVLKLLADSHGVLIFQFLVDSAYIVVCSHMVFMLLHGGGVLSFQTTCDSACQ